jgi:predicted amidophosphoribosyltransferase
MQVRICPECETEYLPRIERCSDCDVALVDRVEPEDDESEDESPDSSQALPSGLPPGEYVALVRRERAVDLDPLAARLGGQRIPFRVDVRQGLSFELRVRREERTAALAALQDLLTPSDVVADAESAAYESCPACETALPEGARACPECSLELVFEAPRCTTCEREIDPDDGRCLHCEPSPASD